MGMADAFSLEQSVADEGKRQHQQEVAGVRQMQYRHRPVMLQIK